MYIVNLWANKKWKFAVPKWKNIHKCTNIYKYQYLKQYQIPAEILKPTLDTFCSICEYYPICLSMCVCPISVCYVSSDVDDSTAILWTTVPCSFLLIITQTSEESMNTVKGEWLLYMVKRTLFIYNAIEKSLYPLCLICSSTNMIMWYQHIRWLSLTWGVTACTSNNVEPA